MGTIRRSANNVKVAAYMADYRKNKRQWQESVDFVSTINNINKLANVITHEEQRNESNTPAE